MSSSPKDADDLLYSIWGSALRCWSPDNASLATWEHLWPNQERLEIVLKSIPKSERYNVALRCCVLAIACGSARVLRNVIEVGLVMPDQTVGPHQDTLLHLACIFRNEEAIKLLAKHKASWRKNSRGLFPEDVCRTKLALPVRRRIRRHFFGSSSPLWRRWFGSRDIVEGMFSLVSEGNASAQEVQLLLQDNNFDVNKERYGGDFLIHVIVRQGIQQIPLLFTICGIQEAKVNKCNLDGMTPLAIAADRGDTAMAELLMCLLNANPNLPNSETGLTPLHYAARREDFSMIDCLLKYGALCNIEDKTSRFPERVTRSKQYQTYLEEKRMQRSMDINLKCSLGELTRKLLHEGDLTAVDLAGDTPLMAAVKADRVDMIELLSEFKSLPLNAQNSTNGKTCLSMCAELGRLQSLKKIMKLLKARGALYDGLRIHDFGPLPFSPLQYACTSGHSDCVRQILRCSEGLVGLDTAQKLKDLSKEVYQLLDEAVARRQKIIVKSVLFEACKTRRLESLEKFDFEDCDDLNIMDEDGNLAMHLAAKNGSLDIIQFLKEKGSFLLCPHVRTGKTSLHIAAREGHPEVVEYLARFCIRDNDFDLILDENESLMFIDALDGSGATALEYAVINEGEVGNNLKEVVEILLKAGASAAKTDRSGKLLTSMIYPRISELLQNWRRNQIRMISEIMNTEKGPDELKRVWKPPYDHNLRDQTGDSPLMIACSCGRLDLLDLLLESVSHYQLLKDEKTAAIRELAENAREELLGGADDRSQPRERERRHRSNELFREIERIQFNKEYLLACNPVDGRAAIHRAVEREDPAIVRKILSVDPRCVNLPDADGKTALHLACQRNNMAVVRELLSCPLLDLSLRDGDGKYPEEDPATNQRIKKMAKDSRDRLYQPLRESENNRSESFSENRHRRYFTAYAESTSSSARGGSAYPSGRSGTTIVSGEDPVFEKMNDRHVNMKSNRHH